MRFTSDIIQQAGQVNIMMEWWDILPAISYLFRQLDNTETSPEQFLYFTSQNKQSKLPSRTSPRVQSINLIFSLESCCAGLQSCRLGFLACHYQHQRLNRAGQHREQICINGVFIQLASNLIITAGFCADQKILKLINQNFAPLLSSPRTRQLKPNKLDQWRLKVSRDRN